MDAAGEVSLQTPVEVLWVARFDYMAGRYLRPHSHDYGQIIVIRDGAGAFLLEDKAVPIAPGQTWFLQPNQVHGLRAETYLRTLDVKFSVPQDWSTALSALPTLIEDAPPEAAESIEQVRDAARAGGALARAATGVHMQVALLALLQHHAGMHGRHSEAADGHLPDDPVCAAALRYLHEHYGECVTGDSIAAAIGYSYRHISQRCVVTLGVTPQHYLMHYRIRRAQELMFWSDYPIKDISARVGFTTVHHFTRVFSQLVGVPPAQWRQQEQAAIGQGFTLHPGVENVLFV